MYNLKVLFDIWTYTGNASLIKSKYPGTDLIAGMISVGLGVILPSITPVWFNLNGRK